MNHGDSCQNEVLSYKSQGSFSVSFYKRRGTFNRTIERENTTEKDDIKCGLEKDFVYDLSMVLLSGGLLLLVTFLLPQWFWTLSEYEVHSGHQNPSTVKMNDHPHPQYVY